MKFNPIFSAVICAASAIFAKSSSELPKDMPFIIKANFPEFKITPPKDINLILVHLGHL